MQQKSYTASEIAAVKWFHRIDLGDGIITPGVDNSPEKLRFLGMPEDLRGQSVLDIGAWDGFFSFEAERRGARRVLATDGFMWCGKGWGSKAGFELARRALISRVEDLSIDLYDITAAGVGRYDLVLFLGVLYHLKHPLLGLERVFDVTANQLILETHVDLISISRPAMAFYPGVELGGDESNWFGPNPAAVEAMLLKVGFSKVRLHWLSVPEPLPSTDVIGAGRAVFHAWR